ncbi:ras-related protein Rab-39B-like [Numida meleagris]|uniref:ras-related protein Rab-39B-like n=1 Tax=Numida meleagris TaxID=8996 RepID=UPI000B3DB12B|nr:ras-related protein Rab-39B-like [Numida meleagris]
MASATDSRYGQKESSDQNFDYMFKILIIGNSSVGKTSFLFRYADDSFTPAFVSTVGIDFKVKTIYRNDKRIKLQIWDTAGQERFRSITRAYYRNSVGGLLLFDITNRRSFQNVHEWLEETKVHVQPYQIVFVLVGHKCDLDTQRQVTRHEAEKLAAAYGMKYIETSARDAINVEKAFTDLTRDIYELVKRGEISIQEGWEGVKSGFVPNVVHSSEEVVKSDRRCLC